MDNTEASSSHIEDALMHLPKQECCSDNDQSSKLRLMTAVIVILAALVIIQACIIAWFAGYCSCTDFVLTSPTLQKINQLQLAGDINLAQSGLTTVQLRAQSTSTNPLFAIDLRDNNLTDITDLSLPQVSLLSLTGNPLTVFSRNTLSNLSVLELPTKQLHTFSKNLLGNIELIEIQS